MSWTSGYWHVLWALKTKKNIFHTSCSAYCSQAKLKKAKRPMHGIVDTIDHDGKGIFKGLKNPLNVTRYHSLILERSSIDNTDLVITAKTKDSEVMGIRHKFYKIEGVQFHPESIATEQGLLMIKNFLRG